MMYSSEQRQASVGKIYKGSRDRYPEEITNSTYILSNDITD